MTLHHEITESCGEASCFTSLLPGASSPVTVAFAQAGRRGRRNCMARWQVGGLVATILLLGVYSIASADSYVAIGGGLNFAELDSTDAGTIRLKQNGFFGAKLGHYFDDRQYNWLGFEVDLYRAAPSIKQQTVNGSTNQTLGGSSGAIPGADFLVHSLAFNALIRLTGYQYKVEPYTGLGIGLN